MLKAGKTKVNKDTIVYKSYGFFNLQVSFGN